ncbi:hypothetical protein AEGHOMDF_4056 [Methylobacterium soli]|nr:hypothetical protein AEGHOMDF_4056 [Methylobacterium soli]
MLWQALERVAATRTHDEARDIAKAALALAGER